MINAPTVWKRVGKGNNLIWQTPWTLSLDFVQFRFQQWVLSSPGEIDLWPALKSSNMLDWMPALPSLISFRNLLLLQCSRPFTWAQLHWQLKDIERISNFPIFTFASLGGVVLSLTVHMQRIPNTLNTLLAHCSVSLFNWCALKNGVRKNDWTLRQYVNVMWM